MKPNKKPKVKSYAHERWAFHVPLVVPGMCCQMTRTLCGMEIMLGTSINQ